MQAPTTDIDSHLRPITDSWHALLLTARQSVPQSTTQLSATKRRCRPLVQARIHERGRQPCHAHKMSTSYADCDDVAVNRTHEHTSVQLEDQIANDRLTGQVRPNRVWNGALWLAQKLCRSTLIFGPGSQIKAISLI